MLLYMWESSTFVQRIFLFKKSLIWYSLLLLLMEEKQDAGVDDVDRESLVKEIELIRQTLGDALTRARSDHGASFDDQGTEEYDDSEDELGINQVNFYAFEHVWKITMTKSLHYMSGIMQNNLF